jgi:hypothetical protein
MKKDKVIGYRNGIPVVNRTLRVKANEPQFTYRAGKNYIDPKATLASLRVSVRRRRRAG